MLNSERAILEDIFDASVVLVRQLRLDHVTVGDLCVTDGDEVGEFGDEHWGHVRRCQVVLEHFDLLQFGLLSFPDSLSALSCTFYSYCRTLVEVISFDFCDLLSDGTDTFLISLQHGDGVSDLVAKLMLSLALHLVGQPFGDTLGQITAVDSPVGA